MIDDEAQLRVSADRLPGGGQLWRSDEQVVGEIAVADRCEAALNIGSQQPAGVRLVVHLVSNAHEPVAELVEGCFNGG